MIKVLVANDDGIDAIGIKLLAKALSDMAEVYVFAPAEEQSGKSHSITFLRPVSVEEREFECAKMAFAIDGTPSDCVKVGIEIMKGHGITPDYVISGINLGYNSGLAAYYSGTVAAAREGAINGIKSIALSLGHHQAEDFEYILGMLPALFDMSNKIDNNVILNVNVPHLAAKDVKGYKIVETAPYGYGIDFVFKKEDGGLYQMTGESTYLGSEIKYDFDANEAGYASISPIPTTLSDSSSLRKLGE